MGGETRLRPFAEVLKDVQEYITKNYADQLKDDPEHSRTLIGSYIRKYLEESSLVWRARNWMSLPNFSMEK